MTFPASTQVKVDGFQELRRTANNLKNGMQARNIEMAARYVKVSYIISILRHIKSAVVVFDEVAAIDGITAYVQDQYADNTIDVPTEFTAMTTAAESVGSWIINNLPKDGNNYLLREQIDAIGNITERTFSIAETVGLRTQINNLIATIG